jgi:hypothetical protein
MFFLRDRDKPRNWTHARQKRRDDPAILLKQMPEKHAEAEEGLAPHQVVIVQGGIR